MDGYLTINPTTITDDARWLLDAWMAQGGQPHRDGDTLRLRLGPARMMRDSLASRDILCLHVRSTLTWRERALRFGIAGIADNDWSGEVATDDYHHNPMPIPTAGYLDRMERMWGDRSASEVETWYAADRHVGWSMGGQEHHTDTEILDAVARDLRHRLAAGAYEVALPTFPTTTPERVRAVMARHNLRQEDLAALMDPPVEQSTVSRWLRGVAEPRPSQTLALRRLLGDNDDPGPLPSRQEVLADYRLAIAGAQAWRERAIAEHDPEGAAAADAMIRLCEATLASMETEDQR